MGEVGRLIWRGGFFVDLGTVGCVHLGLASGITRDGGSMNFSHGRPGLPLYTTFSLQPPFGTAPFFVDLFLIEFVPYTRLASCSDVITRLVRLYPG